MEKIQVSIIILCYNQIEYTKNCLKSLFEHTSQIKTHFEVIVVDNASTDGTVQYLQGLEQTGQIKAIYNSSNRGFPAANNQGAKIAQGEYLCLCNNDVIFTESWLENLIRCMKSDSQIAAVGPYSNASSGYQQVSPQPTYRGEEELKRYAEKFSKEEKYVDFLVFFCVLIKKSVWLELNGLDEAFTPGNYEDNLFCYRLLEKGYKMKVCGNAYIHHWAGTTFQTKDPKKLKEYVSLMARNQKIFLKKIGKYETVSLCMIVSDQEKPETLKRCLDSVAECVDEICIVFNYKHFKNPFLGNKFFKKEIIINENNYFGEKDLPNIAHKDIFIKWKYVKFTDFSDMRNKSLSMAIGKYVIWLDADDICQTPVAIRDLIFKHPNIDVFKCKVLSQTEQKTVETIIHNRLFRRVKDYKSPYWVNRCHEDLSYSMNELEYTHAITNLTIQHWGYIDIRHWIEKNKRNLKLLQQDIKEILASPTERDLKETPGNAKELKPHQRGRLSMLYYGITNSYIILAGSTKNPKKKLSILIQALNTTDECIKLLKNEDPLMSKMWVLRGIICMDSNEHLAAKQSFHKAYDEWKQPEAAVNLAELYLREKNWNKTIEILDEVLDKYKGAYPFQNLSYDPVQLHSLLLEKLGHAWANKAQECKDNLEAFDEYMKKAERYYRECLNIRPKLDIVNLLIQILRNTNRLDEATFLAIKAINKWRGYFQGWYFVAEFEQMNGRYVTAKVFYNECLKLKPGHKEALFNLRQIEEMGKRKNA